MDWLTGGITWLASVTGVAVIGWLLRSWIATRLTHSVRHEYDKKIEAIRSELRQKEAALNAELVQQRDRLSAVQSNALGIASKQNELLEGRRVESI